MSFIRRVIGPDEKLIGISSVHWFYGFKGLMALTLFMGMGAILRSLLARITPPSAHLVQGLDVIGNYIFWTCTIIGGFIFLFYLIVLLSTEIALTTKRVIFKKGLIAVDVREVDLEEIKAADVNNGLFGRFLNYGYLLFDARFVNNLQLPAIGDPYRFIKALNDARSRMKNDTMRVILNDRPDAEVSQARRNSAQQPDPQDPRYEGLSNNPMEELRRMPEDIGYRESMENNVGRGKRARKQSPKKHMKPVIFNKARLHDKLLDSFTMMSRYGSNYEM